jgi:hypothetical protein
MLGLAQQYKVLKIDKLEKNELFSESEGLIDVNIGSTDAKVFFYLPNLKDSLEFEPNIKSFLLNKKYNSQENRWELSFTPNKFTVLVVKAPGFKPVSIDIKFAAKSITEFQVYEVTSDTPAKLTIKANPPDAKISIWSHPQGERIAGGALVGGSYVADRLSAGTVRVLLEKEGYSSLEQLITLQNGENKVVGVLSLDPKIKSVRIESTPSKAEFFLDDNPKQIKQTTFIGDIPGNTRKLTFKNEFFKDTVLVLTEESTYSVILQKKISEIKFFDDKVSKVFIEGKELENKNGYFSYQVPMGERYQIKVSKPDLEDFVQYTPILKSEEEKLVDLQKEWTSYFNRLVTERNNKIQEKKNKTKSTVSFVVGLAGLGSGLYLMQSANKNYDAYKKATSSTEAASLRKQVESADRLSPITLGIGGLFTGIGIVFLLK